jgi:hypothetical protein
MEKDQALERNKRIQKRHPYHRKTCKCGHLIVWIPRRGYTCMCTNPTPIDPVHERL